MKRYSFGLTPPPKGLYSVFVDQYAVPEPPRLFQEKWRKKPFWMLVGCILVNQTQWVRAQPVHRQLMRRWSTPAKLAGARRGHVFREVKGLSFGIRRAECIQKLAAAWSAMSPKAKRELKARDVLRLPGCGAYARDTWAIFIDGDQFVRPSDRKLSEYVGRLRAHQRPSRFRAPQPTDSDRR